MKLTTKHIILLITLVSIERDKLFIYEDGQFKIPYKSEAKYNELCKILMALKELHEDAMENIIKTSEA